MGDLSGYTLFIGAVAIANVVLILWLARSRRVAQRTLCDHLAGSVRGVGGTSDDDSNLTIEDRIERFLDDIRDLLSRPTADPGRQELLRRFLTKSESKRQGVSLGFEQLHSVAVTLVEIYPLLGIGFTVWSMFQSFSGGQVADVSASQDAVTHAVDNFGVAIETTVAGLFFAVVFMFVQAIRAPGVERFVSMCRAYKEALHIAQRESLVSSAK